MHNITKKNIYIMKKSRKIWQRNINYNQEPKEITELNNIKLKF